MTFAKKILVLKRTESSSLKNNKALTGIVRIEVENGLGEVHFSLVNLPKDGVMHFYALIIDGVGQKHYFELGKNPSSCTQRFEICPELNGGVVAGVYVVKDGIPQTLAFARTEDSGFSIAQFNTAVADKCIEDRDKDTKLGVADAEISEEIGGGDECVLLTENLSQREDFIKRMYNDEAVATENYFEFAKFKDKNGDEDDRELQPENELADCRCQEGAPKERACAYRAQNETDDNQRKGGEEQKCYYQTVKSSLDEIFIKYPEEITLQKHFPDSRWAKISFDAQKYYVVGLIKENGKEKYICYGVPSKYSEYPPTALKGYATFIPVSLFDMTGDGFWVMFQDAFSGKCIAPKEQ